MDNFSVKFMYEYIQNENYQTNKIFNDLIKNYNSNLVVYPKEFNLFSIYFIDILKLLTLCYLKTNELRKKTYLQDVRITKKLKYWPYLGHEDLIKGIDLNNKIYGKNIGLNNDYLKLLFIKYHKYKNKILGFNKNLISVCTPYLDYNLNIWNNFENVNFDFISLTNSFKLPQLNDQIYDLKKIIKYVIQNNNDFYDYKILSQLLENHIRANCNDGKNNFIINGDLVIIHSGVELYNRIIALYAKQQKIKLINITHGESFGVYDDPIWSRYGDHFFADLILGYGNKAITTQKSYKNKIADNTEYIPSNGSQVLKYYNNNFKKINKPFNEIKFYYFPTALNGASHRYGPYRDTSDFIYLKWQKKIFNLFNKQIIIKIHPKEKYKFLYNFNKKPQISNEMTEIIDQVDVFVFDYISTAFNIACATNKPVIYFDLGIRKINLLALNKIKERTIYFDIYKKEPNINDIINSIELCPKNYDFIDDYCLHDKKNNRSQAVYSYLLKNKYIT